MKTLAWSRDRSSERQFRLAVVVHGSEPQSGCQDALQASLGKEWSTRWVSIVAAEQASLRTIEGYVGELRKLVTSNDHDDPTFVIVGWNVPVALVQELAYQLLGQDQDVEAVVAVPPDPESQWLQSFLGVVRAADAYVEKPSPVRIRLLNVEPRATDAPNCMATQVAQALKQDVVTSRAKAQREYNPLVTIQPSGLAAKNTIVCIPGAGNNVTSFFELSSHMRHSAIFGLQPRGLDNGLVPSTTVRSAAAMYLRSMDASQFRGPVHLVGHSFGGWVAFEIALEMQQRGVPPRSVTLIDSDLPSSEDAQPEYTFDETLIELSGLLELASERPLRLDAATLAGRVTKAKIAALHQRMTSAGLLPSRSRPEVIEGVVHTFGAALRCNYQPSGQYFGPLRLVCVPAPNAPVEEFRAHRERLREVWGEWAADVSLWTGAGNHMTVLRNPHVASLANWLEWSMEM
jgi:arthrofactin-type cyclic lipopeptide synthetase C